VRNSFAEASSEDQFTLEEQEQLAELFNNRTLKLKYSQENLNTFWNGVGNVHDSRGGGGRGVGGSLAYTPPPENP
jgi:hypothetical protein